MRKKAAFACCLFAAHSQAMVVKPKLLCQLSNLFDDLIVFSPNKDSYLLGKVNMKKEYRLITQHSLLHKNTITTIATLPHTNSIFYADYDDKEPFFVMQDSKTINCHIGTLSKSKAKLIILGLTDKATFNKKEYIFAWRDTEPQCDSVTMMNVKKSSPRKSISFKNMSLVNFFFNRKGSLLYMDTQEKDRSRKNSSWYYDIQTDKTLLISKKLYETARIEEQGNFPEKFHVEEHANFYRIFGLNKTLDLQIPKNEQKNNDGNENLFYCNHGTHIVLKTGRNCYSYTIKTTIFPLFSRKKTIAGDIIFHFYD